MGDNFYLEEYLYAYIDDIDTLKTKIEQVKSIDSNIKIYSICDFITKNNIVGEKYKLTRKLNKNYNKYKNNYKTYKSYDDDVDLFFSNLVAMQSALDDHSLSSNYKINNINESSLILLNNLINIDKNDLLYDIRLLLNIYNFQLIQYIDSINLLDVGHIDYVDSHFKDKYYDERKKSWLIKIKYDQFVNLNMIDKIFNSDTSIRDTMNVLNLKTIYFFIIPLSFFVGI